MPYPKSERLFNFNYPKGRTLVNLSLLTLIIYIIVGFTTSAQSIPQIDVLSSEHGLSQTVVNCILQGKDGFLWIGTQDGLNMYDGQKFIVYQNNPVDSLSISNNYILSMCEDDEGYLWVGTMAGGLNRFDKRKQVFKRFVHEPENLDGIPDNSIWTILADTSGFIFAGTSKGLSKIHIQTNKIRNFFHVKNDKRSISPGAIFSSYKDVSGDIWLGAPSGLSKYNRETEGFINYSNEGKHKTPLVWSFGDDNGNLLIGSNRGLWKFENEESDFEKMSIPGLNDKAIIWSILKDCHNRIWLGTNNGIHCYSESDPESGFTWLKDEEGLNNVWNLIVDQSGLIWAGSDIGLLRINCKGSDFSSISSESKGSQQLSISSVNSIFKDSNKNLWVGTDGGGLNFFDGKTGERTVYKTNDVRSGSISANRVWAIMEDRDGVIWVGTYGGGLNSFNMGTASFETYRFKENQINSLSNNRVLVLMEDQKGFIWIGTRGGGLNCFNKKTKSFEVYQTADSGNVVASNTILALEEDAEGKIWIGTFEGGLSIFNPETVTFTNYRNDPRQSGSLSNNSVWTIHFDKQNRVWLGTQAGLNYANVDDLTEFKLLSQVHGLKSNVIFNLQEDEQGNLWMSTFKGITKLNKLQFEEYSELDNFPERYFPDQFNPLFSNFDKTDGLISNEFNQGAGFQSKDGIIYFGGLHGLCYFHPDSIIESSFNPQIKLTNFKIFNKETDIDPHEGSVENQLINENEVYYLPSGITFLDELSLSYKESVFSFEFASLDFTQPQKNQFAFIMDGFESDWNYVTNQRMVTYTNLDAGEYVFKVKGTNSDGVWSNNEAQIKIYIQPPFWKTLWFIALSVFMILLVMFLIIRRVFQQQKQKAVQEREKMELQLKTIKNQIDPHFAFNAMNMMGSLVYKNDPDAVYDYFTRFAQLIRSTLQDSERISRPIHEEITFVTNYIEIQKTRFKNKFDYSIKLDPKIDQGFEIPKMIIQTHSENAIKHGLMHKKEHGFLKIDLGQPDSNTIVISIEDDGVGRIKAAELSKRSTKKGMQIIDQIFSIYNKLFKYGINQQIIDLANEDGTACGTKVMITISKNGKQ